MLLSLSCGQFTIHFGEDSDLETEKMGLNCDKDFKFKIV